MQLLYRQSFSFKLCLGPQIIAMSDVDDKLVIPPYLTKHYFEQVLQTSESDPSMKVSVVHILLEWFFIQLDFRYIINFEIDHG